MVLGFDFGGTKIAVALRRSDGRTFGDCIVDTEPAAGGLANLERAVSAAQRLMANVGASVELAAVGACTFGIPREEGVALAPVIPGWDALPLRRLIEEAFSVPVAVLTDVKAAAVAEARFGALAGADPGLYLNLGTGLAAAIVVDGRVVRGAHGASGEIAYNLRSPEDLWGSGTLPVLEDVVSGRGLSIAAAALVDGAGPAPAWSERPASDVFTRAASETGYAELISRFTRELAYHLVNLVIALDPEVVAVGGGIVGSWGVLAPSLAQALEAHVPYPPRLVVGAFPHDAALRGAIAEGFALAARASDGSTMITTSRT